MLIGLQQKSIKHMLVMSLGPTEAVVKSEDLNKLTRARAKPKPSKKPENVDQNMGGEEEWEDMPGDEVMSDEEEEVEYEDEEAMDDNEADGEDTEVF